MIAVDDLNNRIGCYGDPIVKTPNIDRLARRASASITPTATIRCAIHAHFAAERAASRDTRIYDNNTAPRTYLGNAVFLPEYYRSQGYFTAGGGEDRARHYEHQLRWTFPKAAPACPSRRMARCRTRTPRSIAPPNKPRRQPGKTRPPKRPEDASRRGRRRRRAQTLLDAHDRADADEPDGATARRIAQILRESKDKPFFVGCGFHKPHLPWVAPRKYFAMYSLDRIKLPTLRPTIATTFRPSRSPTPRATTR